MNSKHINISFLSAAGLLTGAAALAQDRPNFVFLMAEDLSKESFALYNGNAAQTPNLEKMARHGIIFNNAYSCAPVSSAARSSLITGCYAPSMGISWHRKLDEVVRPEWLHLFPYYLRQAGYHTTNCSKTDYNCTMDSEAWDQVKGKLGDWRNRKDPSQPFFHCLTIATCHESSLHFPEKNIGNKPTSFNPEDVVLLPIHPDTKTFRYTYARHYDEIRKVDDVLGEMLDMLKKDGVLDNTFVFYFGDNGGCLPGTKAYTGDLGLHVPFVVYIPDKWKGTAPVSLNSSSDAIISFLDLAPTLLNLAGLEIPSYMDGKPFLGPGVDGGNLQEMDETVCYGDRFDELYACNRVVRKQDFSYSRNFYPYHPKSVYGYYRMHQAAFREWYQMHYDGKLNPIQDRFFQPQGAENLFLLSEDKYETQDLAGKPEYGQMLKKMREILDRKMLAELDLGIIPEFVWVGDVSDIEKFKDGIRSKYPDYLAAANIVRKSFVEASRELKKDLKSKDEIIQFWALVACNTYGQEAAGLKKQILALAENGTPAIRSKAGVYAARFLRTNPETLFNSCIEKARNKAEILSVLNDAAYLKDACPALHFHIQETGSLNDENSQWRLTYLNE